MPGDVSAKFRAHEQAVGGTCRRFHGTSCSAECQFFVDLRVRLLCGGVVTGLTFAWFLKVSLHVCIRVSVGLGNTRKLRATLTRG